MPQKYFWTARRLVKSFYITNIYTSLNAETCMLFMSLVQCDKTNKTFRIEHMLNIGVFV